MRRFLGKCFLVFSLFLLLNLAGIGANTRLSGYCITQAELLALRQGRTEDASLEPVLTFDDQALIYDSFTGTYYYSISPDISSFDDPRVLISDPSIRIAADWDEYQAAFSAEHIKAGHKLPLTVYSDTGWRQLYLSITTIPLMNVIASMNDIPTADLGAVIMLYDNETCSETSSAALIRVRGRGSLGWDAHNYKLSLKYRSPGEKQRKNNLSLLGMRADDDWILYSTIQDQEKIRNVFSARLWREACARDNGFHMDTSHEFRFLELFINGHYQGLYALGYKPDEKTVGISTDRAREALYTKYWKQTSPENGGYVRNSKADETAEDDPILRRFMTRLGRLCLKESDPSALQQAVSVFDMDNAADLYLFIDLIQAVDHIYDLPEYANDYQNVLLALLDGGERGFFIPWDFDYSWGEAFSGTYSLPADYRIKLDEHLEIFDSLVQKNPDFLKMVSNKYRAYRQGFWSDESIQNILDGYEAEIFASGAYVRSMEKWPGGKYLEDNFGLSRFREYVLERFHRFDLVYASE